MCGIAGLLDPARATSGDELRAIAMTMADALQHRGPDDVGAWADPAAGVAFGHRRLAIIDVSSEGHQPMEDASGRYTITFNGEVYNYRELRRTLEGGGARFRGSSDTEVLLAAIARWGLEKTLDKANGMWAFGLWDSHAARLHLVRDRLGEKPLYYGHAGGHFVFASELKALRAHPGFRGTIDRSALSVFFRRAYVPGPRSIYVETLKLPPGSALTLGADDVTRLPEPCSYWSLTDVAARARADPFEGTVDDAAEELSGLLGEAVAMRAHADVPLGAFLSGGIDSSIVVALMQAHSNRQVRTFTVGMPTAALDEASHARAVATHLGTEHVELFLQPQDAIGLVPRLSSIYDEPFADPSQIPTALVCQLARRHVTVGLSGDGGDEVFGGYNRYVLGPWAWRRAGSLPRAVRHRLAHVLTGLSPSAWDALVGRALPLLPRRLRVRQPGDKVHKLALVLQVSDERGVYESLAGHWSDPAALVLGGAEPADLPENEAWRLGGADLAERMMLADQLGTLPEDMLVKVDRSSMASSLEARVPLLDHRIVAFSWRLPLDLKIRDGQGKWILQRVLHRHVPSALVERPKAGFDPPIATWLRGPLRAWATDLLEPRRLRQEGFLEPQLVQQAWAEHQAGRRNWDYRLWTVLMFQAWLGEQ